MRYPRPHLRRQGSHLAGTPGFAMLRRRLALAPSRSALRPHLTAGPCPLTYRGGMAGRSSHVYSAPTLRKILRTILRGI